MNCISDMEFNHKFFFISQSMVFLNIRVNCSSNNLSIINFRKIPHTNYRLWRLLFPSELNKYKFNKSEVFPIEKNENYPIKWIEINRKEYSTFFSLTINPERNVFEDLLTYIFCYI